MSFLLLAFGALLVFLTMAPLVWRWLKPARRARVPVAPGNRSVDMRKQPRK